MDDFKKTLFYIVSLSILFLGSLQSFAKEEDDILLFIPAIISGTLNQSERPTPPTPIPTPCNELVIPRTIEQPFTIPTGCHVLTQSISVESVLTIQAGAELHFADNDRLSIRNNGTLKAIGNTNQRIIFTAQNPQGAGWRGIQFTDSDNDNRLSYVSINYAHGLGENCGGQGTVGSVCFESIVNKTQISLSNITVSQSDNYGLIFDNDTQINEFQYVRLTSNQTPIRIPANLVHHLDDESFFGGNQFNRIDVGTNSDNDIENSQTWKNLHVPYQIIHGIDVISGWTIEAGTEMQFTINTSVVVNNSGFLNAIGSATHVIRFTGSQEDTPGHWRGISVRSDSEHNILDYVSLSDGGGSGSSANLDMVCFDNDPARMTVSNSRIYESAGWGIDNDSDCNLTLINIVT